MASPEILEVLGNKYNPDILSATDEPQSAQQISEELDVPIATAYRRIDELTETGLLRHEDRVLSDEHRRTNVYRRGVDEIRITFTSGSISVTVEERTQVKNKLDEVWRTLSES